MRALPVLLATLLALAPLAPLVARAGEPTVDERLARLRTEQAGLQARADGEGRVGLLSALRTGGLLADALAVRLPLDSNQPLDALTAPRRQAYIALADLTDALGEAMSRPRRWTASRRPTTCRWCCRSRPGSCRRAVTAAISCSCRRMSLRRLRTPGSPSTSTRRPNTRR
jgi:hypothetical protein